MNTPSKKLTDAVKVLSGYYAVLSDRIAGEIIERKEEFTPAGTQAEAILDKHAREVQQLGTVYAMLRAEAYPQKPQGTEPLARDEFRCFGCGGVIGATDPACPTCGWSWK